MNIKTFEFCVNCFKGNKLDYKLKNNQDKEIIDQRVTNPSEIDRKINNYLAKKDIGKVLSINENFYIKSHHNNGGQDTIVRSITIITE